MGWYHTPETVTTTRALAVLINCTESFQASEKISCSFEHADLSVYIENIVVHHQGSTKIVENVEPCHPGWENIE